METTKLKVMAIQTLFLVSKKIEVKERGRGKVVAKKNEGVATPKIK